MGGKKSEALINASHHPGTRRLMVGMVSALNHLGLPEPFVYSQALRGLL